MEEYHNSFHIVPFRPAFGEARKHHTKESSKCMSMRRHRASLYIEQSVTYLADKNKKTFNKLNKTDFKMFNLLRIKMEFLSDFIHHVMMQSPALFKPDVQVIKKYVYSVPKHTYTGIYLLLGPYALTSTAGSFYKMVCECVCIK